MQDFRRKLKAKIYLAKPEVSHHGADKISYLFARTALNQQVFLVPENPPWAQIEQSLTEEPSANTTTTTCKHTVWTHCKISPINSR